MCSHRMHTVKALTIRNVDDKLARALEKEKRRRGTSLNETVLEVLRGALGVLPEEGYSNGLAKLAGTWSDADVAAMDEATAAFEQIDLELWP